MATASPSFSVLSVQCSGGQRFQRAGASPSAFNGTGIRCTMVGHCLFALEIVNILGTVRARAHASQIPHKLPLNVRKTLARRRETIFRWLLTASVGLHICLPALCPRRVFACQLNQAAPFEFLWQSWKVSALVDPRMPAQLAHILVIRITS